MQELKDIQQGVGTRDDRQLYSNDENYKDSSKKWQYTQSGLAESWCVAGEEMTWQDWNMLWMNVHKYHKHHIWALHIDKWNVEMQQKRDSQEMLYGAQYHFVECMWQMA